SRPATGRPASPCPIRTVRRSSSPSSRARRSSSTSTLAPIPRVAQRRLAACGIAVPTTKRRGGAGSGAPPAEGEAGARLAAKFDLDFTLLADADHKVAEKYGTWVEKSMYGKKYMGVQRATFIVDPKGKIAKVFPKVSPKTHDDVVLKALAEL